MGRDWDEDGYEISGAVNVWVGLTGDGSRVRLEASESKHGTCSRCRVEVARRLTAEQARALGEWLIGAAEFIERVAEKQSEVA
jgi:hypothetical protein